MLALHKKKKINILNFKVKIDLENWVREGENFINPIW